VDAELKFFFRHFSNYQYAEAIYAMNKNGSGLIGRRVRSSNQPRPASISSIVFDEDFQPFEVGGALTLKEDNVPISETPQANEPKRAAIAELGANPWFGVILQDYDGRLVLGQFHGLFQKLVAILPARGGWLQHLASPVIQRFNNQCRVVGVVKGLWRLRGRAGGRDNSQSHKGQ
jgi:hypothetical protein